MDTSKAGANIIVADGTENTVNGAYVAKIYKPGSVELSSDGKEVVDAKKLHKYDGAVYSKMSMNISGGQAGDGLLSIYAENEGLVSELHLTINGGDIAIESGNDGINTNEDGISVTTINGGNLSILVNGATGEGDGIDSNGYLVINGGFVFAQACGTSMDSGIDSDMGIHINGGTVIASGNMLDRIESGGQTYATYSGNRANGEHTVCLKDKDGNVVVTHTIVNSYSILVVSSPVMAEAGYTVWDGDTQLQVGNGQGGSGGHGGMMPPDGDRPARPTGERPERPDGMEPPEGMPPFEGNHQPV